jgi:O-antigen/teichoic acid export membrane protein
MYASDNIIIARVIGPQAVASYSIAGRLFLFAPLLISAFLTPLWPAYADALARNDRAWIRRTAKRSLLLSIVVSASFGSFMVVFGQWLLSKWVGSAVSVSPWLLGGMAVWGLSSSVGSALSMVLNGLQVIRAQAGMAIATAAAAIAFKVFAASRLGATAVPWAQVVAHAITALVPAAVMARQALADPPTDPETSGSEVRS